MNINYRINTNTKQMTLITNKTDIKLTEGENLTTSLIFSFDRPVKETDRLAIQITNSKFTKPYRLERVQGNKYNFDLPREALIRGRLTFTIHHYDKDYFELAKYSPEAPMHVTAGGDITNDTIEVRPDLFAEMMYEIKQLKKEVEILRARG